MKNFGNAHLVEPGVTNWPVTTIGMWGYMPVRITGVLVVIINARRPSSAIVIAILSIRSSVCLFICHTGDSHLSSSVYQDMLCNS